MITQLIVEYDSLEGSSLVTVYAHYSLPFLGTVSKYENCCFRDVYHRAVDDRQHT